MSEQEKNPTPATGSDTPQSTPAAQSDVAIAESAGSVQQGSAAAPAVAVGRPPIAKILTGIAAALVVALLWIIAGNVKLQACVSQAEAQYGTNTDPKSLATLGRKNAVLRCSNSPF